METISGKFCPVCKFKNDISATACSYCGASLENIHQGETTTKHVDSETRILVGGQPGEVHKKGIIPPPRGIAIYLQDGTPVEIRTETEFFLGRKVEEGEDALVDLIPFGAFQTGVSRRHALIREIKRGYEIVDLESTNGTFIDGSRLVSNRPYPLPNFSQVSLGRLNLFIVYGKIATKEKKS